jgi:hypothetical protein
LSCERANVRPKLDKRAIYLLNISHLLLSWGVVHTTGSDFIRIDLELQLVLNMHPEHSKKVFWVLRFIWVPVLIQVFIFHQSLASMNLRFKVLAIHENTQKAFGGVKTENLSQVCLSILNIWTKFITIFIIWIVSVDNLRNCHANIPNNLGRALSLIV